MDLPRLDEVEDDEGVTEALRRSEEMDRDPSVCLTDMEFLKEIGSG